MVIAVILAAGTGSRMHSSVTKQQMTVLGKSVIWRAVSAFEACDDIDRIIVVCRSSELEFMEKELSEFGKLFKMVVGGSTRAESSYIGSRAIDCDCDIIAIHDAARCLITPSAISKIVIKARECGAATAATPVTDTVKRISDGKITDTLDRSELMAVQTPQVFEFHSFLSAFERVDIGSGDITDDNMIYERAGLNVSAVDIGTDNIKITTPRDILLAELILKERGCE